MYDIDYEKIVKEFSARHCNIFYYKNWEEFCNIKGIQDHFGTFLMLLDLDVFVPTPDDCADYALDYYTFIIKNK
jgi:hypothetical protein